MGRKKVEQRKKRVEPFPIQLCVMISPELSEKIQKGSSANGLTKSQMVRRMLETSTIEPKYTQLAIA
jgi:predicted DNA-binding protein